MTTRTQYRRLEAVTERAGLDPETLADSIERLFKSHRLAAPAGALTAPEVEFLDAYSGTTADPEGLFDAQVATAIAETEQDHNAYTTAQVAKLLGVSTGRIRQLVNEGRLYALPSSKGRGTTRLFPDWQFVDGEPLPHVGEVASALPASTHPLAVRAFFLTGRIEIRDEESMTVANWLRSGGAVEPVLDLVLADTHGL